MKTGTFKQIEFDLAYLMMLTQQGLKPLSRWENSLPPDAEGWMGEMGLKVREVRRRAQRGGGIQEFVFSPSDQHLDLYAARFEGRPIDCSPETRRFEGLLFGYPSCCVESYVRNGYARNRLRRSEQRLLFHWACPACAQTPLLIPHYRRVNQECRRLMRGGISNSVSGFVPAVRKGLLREAVATAASMISLGILGSNLDAAASGADPHRLAYGLAHDADQDLLSDVEEQGLATDPQQPDENGNHILDGIDWATQLAARIEKLPTQSNGATVYRTDFMLKGLEWCSICGQSVNMGHLTICNPQAQLYAKLPYIALHFMEHGSLAYDGSVHGQGRLWVRHLVETLESKGPGHLISIGSDDDKDGLMNREEQWAGTQADRPDSDTDGVPDGPSLAYELGQTLESLPRIPIQATYAIDHYLRGLVTCPICGQTENMGWMEIVNPRENMRMEVSYLAQHFLRHGSFTTREGERLNPAQFSRLLKGDGSSHLVISGEDTDRDGLLDREEVVLNTDGGKPDTDGDGVLDGIDLARRLSQKILRLPIGPSKVATHRILHEANCFKPCPICLENINCGFCDLINPWADLRQSMSYLNLHYLEHGSFAVTPDQRIDPLALQALLDSGVSVVRKGSQIELGWLGKAGRHYEILTGSSATGPWTFAAQFTGDGTQIQYTDSESDRSSARFYQIRAW